MPWARRSFRVSLDTNLRAILPRAHEVLIVHRTTPTYPIGGHVHNDVMLACGAEAVHLRIHAMACASAACVRGAAVRHGPHLPNRVIERVAAIADVQLIGWQELADAVLGCGV